MFCKTDAIKYFANFTEKHQCRRAFFNKVASCKPTTLLKERLWHLYFPVSLTIFLRTPLKFNISGGFNIRVRENPYSGTFFAVLGFSREKCYYNVRNFLKNKFNSVCSVKTVGLHEQLK